MATYTGTMDPWGMTGVSDPWGTGYAGAVQAGGYGQMARRLQTTDIAMKSQREAEAARSARISSFQSFISPYLSGLGGTTSASGEPSAAQQALEASILSRGEESQGILSSALARRGIFGGGPSAAAAAKMQADIESNVALSRAQFEESEAQRQSQESMARQQVFSNLMGQLGAM